MPEAEQITTNDPPAIRGAARDRMLRAMLVCAVLTPVVWIAGRTIEAGTGTSLAPGLLALWAAVSLLMLARLDRHPFARFGAANTITALRAACTVILAGFVFAPEAFAGGKRWGGLGIAAAILALDGLDGALARRSGLASRYGARFDMEVDAGLTLILSLIAWRTGAAGPAILALALPHYTFRALAPALPWLDGPLPPSLMRKAVCVLQVATPMAILTLPSLPATTLTGIALAALGWSFGRDILRLRRQSL